MEVVSRMRHWNPRVIKRMLVKYYGLAIGMHRRLAGPVVVGPSCVMPHGRAAGRAALLYISRPFRGKVVGFHSNEAEVLAIAGVLASEGMEIFVFDYDSLRTTGLRACNLLIGFGNAFEELCRAGCPGQVRVLYHTGAYLPFQNAAEMQRINDFRVRHGVCLRPRRCVDPYGPASQHLCDGIILIGNDWTASTYESTNRPLATIDPTTNAHWVGLRPGPPSGRRGFLWMGGSGCLHKGLDLVIDAFGVLGPDWDLHICGDDDAAEPDFWDHYRTLPGNIHRHGWVHPASDQMRQVLDQCTFVILPSCSEGMATSVLAGMACGLVPVATRESGIDLHDVGFQISQCSISAVEQALLECRQIEPARLMAMADDCLARIAERHTLAKFSDRFRQLITPYIMRAANAASHHR